MNTMNNVKLKDLVLSVAAACICVIVYHVFGHMIDGVIADDYLRTFLAEAVFAALVTGSVILLKKTDLFRSDPALLKSGWTSTGFLFLVLSVLGLLGFAKLLNGASITPVQWLLMIGHVILVGFCEEVLFRGMIQRALHGLFGEDSFAHVLLAVFCAGIIFGCTHLINMDRGNPMLSSVFQAGVTCFMGMYLGAIYYRTGKNIWYTIFLHSLYDFLGMIVNGRANGSTLSSVLSPSGSSLTVEGVMLAISVWGIVYFLNTLFILRPKKVEPLLAKGEG